MFKRSKVASAALIALGGALATAAVAQDAARVEITGSRILSVNAESPAPIQVLTAEDIAASGVTNVQDLLLKNPTFGVPTFSRTNSNFLVSSAGVSTIDLRNLGIARTLVLINGRRVVAGIPGETAVDLNTIPTQFVERIEILTGGSSALYGSDAVAGVVNIILKKDYEGFNIDYKYGVSEKGDDKRHELALTWGATTANGKGNLMGHFGYSRQGAVFSGDRSQTAIDQVDTALLTGDPADFFTPFRPFFSSFAPQGRFFYRVPNPNFGLPNAQGVIDTRQFLTDSRTFAPDGSLIPFSTNGSATLPASGFNRTAFRTIAVPTERFLFASKGSYEFAEDHRAFFEGTYAASQVKSRLEPFPLDSVDVFPATGGILPAEFMVGNQIVRNPLIPDSLYNLMLDSDGDGLRDYNFTRRMSEIGNRGSVADRDTFRMIVGLEGRLFKGWDYNVYAGYGATKESQVSGGQVNVPSFRSSLQAVADINDIDGDGNTTEPICLDAQARAEGCVPSNIFGTPAMGPGFGLSPAAVQYIQAPGILATFTSQKLLGGSISGEPFKLPAGPVGVAAGFEYREEFSRSEFDPLQQAGLNAGNAIPRTEGKYDVQELFAEVRLPLLKDAPFAKALNLIGAVRGGKYSTVGNTLSWNAGFDWAVNDMFTVRASSALSTRAPNINELFSPPSQTFPTGLNDPCVGVTAATVGVTADRCRAEPGVAANIAANGSFTINQADLQGISGFNRGNPALGEEEGKSWTLGVAFKPRGMGYLDNFALTLDYFNIKIDDAIVSTPRQFILDQCYAGDASFCQFLTRRVAAVGSNSAGSLEFIDSAVTNSGGLATEGVDVTVNFADRVGPGRLSAALSYTHLLDGYTIPLPGAAKDPFMGEIGSPRDKLSLKLGYKWNAWSINTQITHIAASALDDQFLAAFGVAPGGVKVPAKTYTDLGLSYQLNKTVQLYGGVDNLFDTKPPLLSSLPGGDTGTETNAGTYDPIGRRYYVGVRAQF